MSALPYDTPILPSSLPPQDKLVTPDGCPAEIAEAVDSVLRSMVQRVHDNNSGPAVTAREIVPEMEDALLARVLTYLNNRPIRWTTAIDAHGRDPRAGSVMLHIDGRRALRSRIRALTPGRC